MSTGLFTLLALLAVAVGALIPVQAATNAAMSQVVRSVPIASLFVFAVGLLVVALWVVVTRSPLPTMAVMRQAPAYAYLGGLIVASYVISITFLAPRLGVGNAICFIVTGQIFAAVIIDHVGAFGSAVQLFSVRRAVGIALMVAGLFLAKRS
jgi:transporter family-2 protein